MPALKKQNKQYVPTRFEPNVVAAIDAADEHYTSLYGLDKLGKSLGRSAIIEKALLESPVLKPFLKEEGV